jgi:GNAT superfamily N-acetyltransferase
MRAGLFGGWGDQHIEYWIGGIDGDPRCAVTIRAPVHENTDLANVAVHVRPEHRRLGEGTAAALAVFDLVRSMGRSRVLAEVPSHTRHDDPSPAHSLVARLGLRPLLAERRRLLRLPDVDRTSLGAEVEKAARAAAGYSTIGWADRAPPELIDDMCRLIGLMSTDPPQGELAMQPEVWDAERFLSWQQSTIDRKRRYLAVAARDDRTGRLVGFTDLAAPAEPATVGYQWATIVAGDHRGHGLGLLMKAVNLQQVFDRLPDLEHLNTWNGEDNNYMVSVNERLGYRPVEGWTEWGREV